MVDIHVQRHNPERTETLGNSRMQDLPGEVPGIHIHTEPERGDDYSQTHVRNRGYRGCGGEPTLDATAEAESTEGSRT